MGDRMQLQRYQSLIEDQETGEFERTSDDEELQGSPSMRRPSRYQKKQIAWLLYGLLAIVGLGVLVVIAFGTPQKPPLEKQPVADHRNASNPEKNQSSKRPDKPFAPPSDFQRGFFGANRQSVLWASGGEQDGLYLEQTNQAIYIKNVQDDSQGALLMAMPSDPALQNYHEWSVSKDLKQILLAVDYQKEWRHSFFANYWIYDIVKQSFKKLTVSKPKDHGEQYEQGAGKVSLTVWSPTGHSIAWVRDNDLYATLEDGREKQLTTDGSAGIINGIADWVYEEEIFEAHEAVWFSTDSTKLAFIKFNETLVREYKLTYYAKDPTSSYPIESYVKYPMPGSPNPVSTLHIVDLTSKDSGRESNVIYQDSSPFKSDDSIITQVTWATSSSLLVRVMNRVQDHQKLYLVTQKVGQWIGQLLRDEPSVDGAWFDNLKPLHMLNNSSYIELQEDNEGFAHLALYQDVSSKTPTEWLTNGPWEVTDFSSFHLETNMVYFMSTEGGSTHRNLFSMDLNTRTKRRLTPPETGNPGQQAVPYRNLIKAEDPASNGFFSVSFSPKSEYYVLSYLGPDVPWQKILSTKSDFSVIVTDNAPLANMIRKYAFPEIIYLSIPNEEGTEMNALMVVPTDFDSSGKTKYPVLFNPYGGPTSQMVEHRYRPDIRYAMAASGFIYLVVDGRGTGLKGRKFRSVVSENLGYFEVLDQIAAARWMTNQPYVDPSRIGIWGWSYGGYLTAKVAEADSGLFSVAMSVAPVTDWRFYDTVYTERYMKTLSENSGGYQRSSVDKMEGFLHAKFLLIHGLSDDNVHFQHSASLEWKLTGFGVPHRVHFYTDSDHTISANGANRAIFQLLADFVTDAFHMPRTDLG